jgi:cell division protein FtsI (penicillin-binding protein 3)
MRGRKGEPRPGGSLVLRRRILLLAFALAGLAVLTRAFQLQAVESERWTEAALDQQRERVPLPARRGTIYDRDGVPLALSHETFSIAVAPREIRDRAAVEAALRGVLSLSRAEARRATDPDRRWVVLPGRFSAEQRQQLGELRGVHYERRLERFYPQGDVGREVIGFVAADGRALGGIEQQMDGMLRGEPGYSVLRRDAHGDAAPAISLPVVPARDGADVHLTIDFDLQEIADAALRNAVDSTGSAGGDLLILDPRTGEMLAAASRRGEVRNLAAITEPYEPGSTLKPFMAAALLAEGLADLTDVIDAEDGRWRDENGRVITDSHASDSLQLREVLIHSSNIGIVKFSSRLQPGVQYQYLRDFGFGTPTGVEYPSEASGVLRRPSQWSGLSAASLAMGYEISVTPLQLGAAYGSLANGGVLMEPFMVGKVTRPDGDVLHRRRPRPLRRVVPREVAADLTKVLVEVVEQGTAREASLSTFAVAGKTGTARRTGANGRYEPGAYNSTFVSYFPAHDPQIVILVKLDRPTGAYYGGLVAAPVTRETLQGILAARSSTLRGGTLLATRMPGALQPASALLPPALAGVGPAAPAEEAHVFTLGDFDLAVEPEPSATAVVPQLRGLPFRDAVLRAHEAGFQVRLAGRGAVRATRPGAGVRSAVGDTLVLIGSER